MSSIDRHSRSSHDKPTTTTQATSQSEEEDEEVLTPSEIKRRARMIRNRESAAASRKKKNDKIVELQGQVDWLLARADAPSVPPIFRAVLSASQM